MEKTKVLLIGYLPPPKEGTATLTELIVSSKKLKNRFDLKLFELKKLKTAQQRGRLAFSNIILSVVNVCRFTVEIIEFKPAIIHMPLAQNRYGFLRDSIFILISKILNRKTCVHFLGGNFDLFYKRQNGLFKIYMRFVIKFIDRLILQAEKFIKHFETLTDLSKTRVLYNGIKTENIEYEKVKTFKNSESVQILFISYLSKAKGALDLVYSAPLVNKESNFRVKYVLCGQPVNFETNVDFVPDPHNGYNKMVEFIKVNKLEDIVELRGVVDDETKNNLFLESDIFVFPTYSEGCGLVVMEAMSFGMPVIMTNVSALSEMIKEGENCSFINPGDKEKLEKAILELIKDKGKREFYSRNNYDVIREKYNPEIFARNIGDIWEELPGLKQSGNN